MRKQHLTIQVRKNDIKRGKKGICIIKTPYILLNIYFNSLYIMRLNNMYTKKLFIRFDKNEFVSKYCLTKFILCA